MFYNTTNVIRYFVGTGVVYFDKYQQKFVLNKRRKDFFMKNK